MNNEQQNDAADVNVTGDPGDVGTSQATQTQATPMTLDDFLKNPKNQSTFDQSVAKAIETAKTKWEADAKLTEDERKSQAISDREQQLNEREAALNKREFTASIVEKLTTMKLPVKLAAVLTEGCTKENIDATLDATITPACAGTTGV